MSNNKANENEFVKMAINGLFIVVLAYGLFISTSIILPLSDLIEPSPKKWYQVIVLSLPYAVIITSWMGFMKSIQENPYKLGIWWRWRFICDLLILLSYYILLSLAGNKILTDDVQIFAIIPIVFLLYMFWDVFKEKEYARDKKRIGNIRRRTTITIKYFFAFALLGISYIALTAFFDNIEWDTIQAWNNFIGWNVTDWGQFMNLNIIFVVISYFLLFSYRNAKSAKHRQRKSI